MNAAKEYCPCYYCIINSICEEACSKFHELDKRIIKDIEIAYNLQECGCKKCNQCGYWSKENTNINDYYLNYLKDYYEKEQEEIEE